MTAENEAREARYAPAAVAQLTGVSAHLLRAWERRYRAVEPERTPGGARRYSEREVARLRLLRRAVEAGNPIGEIASLSDEALLRRVAPALPSGAGRALDGLPIDDLLGAARDLDVDRFERTLSQLLAALGPRAFARDVAGPVLRRIGDAWERKQLSVSAEHAATSVLRNLLGATLRRDSLALVGPTILFTTPAGERHEFGALLAAVEALASGARAVYLGPDLPCHEVVAAARRLGAHAVALGVAGLSTEAAERELRALRSALPADVSIFLGGRGAAEFAALPGVDVIHRMEDLASHVARISR